MVQGNKRNKKSIEKLIALYERDTHTHTFVLYQFYDFIEWKTIKIEYNEISASSVNDKEEKH